VADIKKLRELGKPRIAEEEKYFNAIIKKIEEKMIEVAPYDDNIYVIFMRPGHAYGCCNEMKVDKRVFVQTDKFNKFGYYLRKLEDKYKKEGFNTFIENNGYHLTISWEY
jgi:hypothetical protein